MPLFQDLEKFIIFLDNIIFLFFLREVICIGIFPLSLRFREIPSCPSWYLIKGRFPFILRQYKSLGLVAGGRTQTRGRGPRAEGRDLEAGGRNLKARSWSNLFMEYFSPTLAIFLFRILMLHSLLQPFLHELPSGRRLHLLNQQIPASHHVMHLTRKNEHLAN